MVIYKIAIRNKSTIPISFKCHSNAEFISLNTNEIKSCIVDSNITNLYITNLQYERWEGTVPTNTYLEIDYDKGLEVYLGESKIPPIIIERDINVCKNNYNYIIFIFLIVL